MTRDFSDYIGIPYRAEGRDRAGCDCWGLVVLIYRERLGVTLPSHAGYGDPLSPAAAAAVAAGRAAWQPVVTPQPLDVVLLRVNGAPHHIGLVIRPGWMLHSAAGKDSCIESYVRPYWRARVEGFYTYAR